MKRMVSHGLCDHATDCYRLPPLELSLLVLILRPLSNHKFQHRSRQSTLLSPPLPHPQLLISGKKRAKWHRTYHLLTHIGSCSQSTRCGVDFPLSQTQSTETFFSSSISLFSPSAHILKFLWFWCLLLLSFVLPASTFSRPLGLAAQFLLERTPHFDAGERHLVRPANLRIKQCLSEWSGRGRLSDGFIKTTERRKKKWRRERRKNEGSSRRE